MSTICLQDWRVSAALVLLFAVVLPGCNRGDGRLAVSGTVMIDGQPADSGVVSFLPTEGNRGHSSGAPLQEGTFNIPAEKGLPPGKYEVQVQAFQKTDREYFDVMRGGKGFEFDPVQFEEGGRLEATVAQDSPNRFEFQLNSSE